MNTSIDSILVLTSYISGLLTVLAPCVLPLLPIIIGGSIAGRNKWYPYITTLSLAVSITIFTILLKSATNSVNIDTQIWKTISGSIIIAFGFVYLFPEIWDTVSLKLGLSKQSNTVLQQAQGKQGWIQPILTGAALAPVFTSCSPTYALIVATILPTSTNLAILYTLAYALGLATILLLVTIVGRKFIQTASWATDPEGWFKKVLGGIFLLVGVGIILSWDKSISEWLLANNWYINTADFENNLFKK